MKRKSFGLLLIVVLLSACVNQPASPIVGTELPPTQLRSITHVPISTPTKSILSDLPEPTETKVPTPTITNATKSAYSTEMARSEQLEQQNGVDCLGYPDKLWQYPNPSSNKDWRLAFCINSDTKLPYTKFIKRDGTLSWIVPFYETYGANTKHLGIPDGIIYGGMLVAFWSNDERYAYIKPEWCCVDGPGVVFINGWALYRLNLINGEIVEVLPPSSYSWALSSDKLIYFDFLLDQIFILDIQTMDRIQIPAKKQYYDTGSFFWSPDGKKVIFVSADGEEWWDDNNDIGLSLLLLEVDTMKVTTLITNDKRFFQPDFRSDGGYPWIGTTSIIVSDKDRNLYVLDLVTNSLSIKPTRTPIMSPTP